MRLRLKHLKHLAWFVTLLCAIVFAESSTFVFHAGGRRIEGLVQSGTTPPKALILYFHRAIEDRSAVQAWSAVLGNAGYVLAGYTATGGSNFVEEANAALASLLSRKDLKSVPVISMGASLGTRAAVQWFAADSKVRALVLMAPGEPEATCAALAKSGGRPVLILQAENDEIVPPENAEAIRKCAPPAARIEILKGKSHRFPPSEVSATILQWLTKNRL